MATKHHFIQDIQTDDGWVSDSNSHHIRTVLRLTPGDHILFSNGEGTQWETQITSLDPLRVEIISELQKTVTLPHITLILSAIKPKNIELVLEKVTEIGIDRIILTKTDYSQIPLNTLTKKSTRFKEIIVAAMKQSERATLPELLIIPASEITQYTSELNLVGTTQYTDSPTKLPHILSQSPQPESITLFIGPEGGFSRKEYDIMQEIFTPVTFGTYVLRAETAAIVGSGILVQEKLQ